MIWCTDHWPMIRVWCIFNLIETNKSGRFESHRYIFNSEKERKKDVWQNFYVREMYTPNHRLFIVYSSFIHRVSTCILMNRNWDKWINVVGSNDNAFQECLTDIFITTENSTYFMYANIDNTSWWIHWMVNPLHVFGFISFELKI